MSNSQKFIHHIRNDEIDLKLWDKTILSSVNASVYPLSWYLNITCPQWEALISEDYRTVLPLPVFRRYILRVIIQPPFTWQLGIFSYDIMNETLSEEILNQIPSSYRIKSYYFNKFNKLPVHLSQQTKKYTTELELISSYIKIRANYSADATGKISLANQNMISIIKNISTHHFLEFICRFDSFNSSRIKPSGLFMLRQIISNSLRYRMGEIHGAYSRENNLCATIFFIRFKGRQIIHYAAADDEGIKYGALYLILDKVISENAGKNLILCLDNPSSQYLISLFKDFGAKFYPFISVKKKIFSFRKLGA